MLSMTEAQRAGVLVVSLWVEGSGETLRARVTETSDINSTGEVTSVVGSLEELLKAVERWARTFIDPPIDGSGATGSSAIGGVSSDAGPGSGAPGMFAP
jgi:hypothetical protein